MIYLKLKCGYIQIKDKKRWLIIGNNILSFVIRNSKSNFAKIYK